MRARPWITSLLCLAACGGSTDQLVQANDTLAPGDTAQNGPVDDILCQSSEQVVFHHHAHLNVFLGDAQKWIAAGIGIAPPLQVQDNFVVGGSCFSWLHTHDQTGLIHIESPMVRTFTLGNFFDIWGLPLTPTQVGPLQGTVTAYLDGQPFTGDPATMPLDEQGVLQLDVGSPVHPFEPYTFPSGY